MSTEQEKADENVVEIHIPAQTIKINLDTKVPLKVFGANPSISHRVPELISEVEEEMGMTASFNSDVRLVEKMVRNLSLEEIFTVLLFLIEESRFSEITQIPKQTPFTKA